MTTLTPPAADLAAGTKPSPQPSDLPGRLRAFGVTAVKLVLEVADRRRPMAQLVPTTSMEVAEAIGAMARSAAGTTGGPTAGVRRLHVQLGADGGAEIFGSYTRGDRIGAFAGRLEQRMVHRRIGPDGLGLPLRHGERRWQLVEFILG